MVPDRKSNPCQVKSYKTTVEYNIKPYVSTINSDIYIHIWRRIKTIFLPYKIHTRRYLLHINRWCVIACDAVHKHGVLILEISDVTRSVYLVTQRKLNDGGYLIICVLLVMNEWLGHWGFTSIAPPRDRDSKLLVLENDHVWNQITLINVVMQGWNQGNHMY